MEAAGQRAGRTGTDRGLPGQSLGPSPGTEGPPPFSREDSTLIELHVPACRARLTSDCQFPLMGSSQHSEMK